MKQVCITGRDLGAHNFDELEPTVSHLVLLIDGTLAEPLYIRLGYVLDRLPFPTKRESGRDNDVKDNNTNEEEEASSHFVLEIVIVP